jgi:hypothetical protein
LVFINQRCGLGLEFNEQRLEATFPNGATFYLSGAETERDIEKFLGRALAIVGIDESGSFPEHLRRLVREVLVPCLMDLDGTFVLLGTPKPHCRGYFYEVTTGARKGWSVHQWTWRQNPHVPQTWVAAEMESEGMTEDDPAYQREWCGKWVKSDGQLLYPYDPKLNSYTELPKLAGDWHHVVGVDLGWHDDTAFAVLAYNEDSPTLYGTQFVKRPHLVPEDMNGALDRLTAELKYFEIVADTGGLAKTIVESINRRWSKHIRTAAKTEKLAHAAMIRSDLRKGLIKVLPNAPIIAEWDQLQLTEDGKEDPTVPNHLSDAFLYAYRQSRHFWGAEPPPPETPGILNLSEQDRYDRFVAERTRSKSAGNELFGDAISLDELF